MSCNVRNFASLAVQNVPSEDSDQTAQMSEGIFSDAAAQIYLTLNIWIKI